MEKLKKLPMPIKIFVSVAISLILVFLTAIIMLPFAFIYDFDNHTWEIMHYTFCGIYFVTTMYYLFINKDRR